MTKLILGEISFNKDYTKVTIHKINAILYCQSFEDAFSLGEKLIMDDKSNFFIPDDYKGEVIYKCSEFYV